MYKVYGSQYKDILLKSIRALKTYTRKQISPRVQLKVTYSEEGEDMCSIVPLSRGREWTTIDGERLVVQGSLNSHHINKINTSTTSRVETQQLMMKSFRRKFPWIMWDTIGTMAKIKGR